MSTHSVFGVRDAIVHYLPRQAAYVVILNTSGYVAAVLSNGRYFLPGGGSISGESPEETAAREVREELAHELAICQPIGKATQYFHSVADDTYFEMNATFFNAALGPPISAVAEHVLCWLAPNDAERLFYHECHAWAVHLALSPHITNAA
jgi:8-oxo-dGTP pyrophosphatase MutT (NUDIX family)